MIQRNIEASGIPTLSVTLASEISRKLKLPRAVNTGFPLGHPLSFPGQSFRQLSILRLLLKQFEEINEPGTVLEMDFTESDDPEVHCVVCGT